MDWSKVNKATDDFMDKLFYGVEFCEEIPKCRHLFGSAITPVGYLDYSDSLFEGVENIYYLSGDIGVGKSEFLRSIGVNSLTNDKYYKLGGGSKTCIKDKKVSIGSDCS